MAATVTTEPIEKKKREPRLKVTQELLEHVYKLGSLCLTLDQIRKYYGFSDTGWRRKLEQYPELLRAIEKGKAEKIKDVSGKLFAQIEKGSLQAIIFFLKTQAFWRETDRMPDSEKEKPPFPAISLTVNDPIEAAKIYQRIMIGS